MRSLGETIHELLTQRRPEVDDETDSADLPEPFATIVRNTLKQDAAERWRVGDIERYLNPPPAAPKLEPMVEPVAVVDREEAAPVAPRIPDPPRATAAPAVANESLPFQRSVPTRASTPAERGFPMKWVPVAGLVAAVGLGAVLLHKPAPVETPPVVPVTRPVQSADRTVAPAPRVAAPAKPAAAPNPSAIWRVVAYTYNSRGSAEKKARSINEKRSPWRAEVFAPRGDRAPFYVSLGGRMTRGQAERLQKEAWSKGLPRDTFVRNFSN